MGAGQRRRRRNQLRVEAFGNLFFALLAVALICTAFYGLTVDH